MWRPHSNVSLSFSLTGPAVRNFSENMTADVQYALKKCESLVSGKHLILHGNPSAIAQDFFPAKGSPSTSFFAEYAVGGNFDIFAASGEHTAWILLWKTRSRPIGVRLCLVAQFNLFSIAFDPRAWTMVVFWKEDSGTSAPTHYT